MTPAPGSKSNPDEPGFKVSTKDGSASIKVPHTEKGREFIRLLHEFCDAQELPFKKVARAAQAEQPLSLAASEDPAAGDDPAAKTGSARKTGSTAYALDMRIEQEGWPP